jgi:hypothetical protein
VALLPLAGRGGGGDGEVQVLHPLLSCGALLQSLLLPADRGGEGGWGTAATPPVLQSGGGSRWLGRSSAAAATSSWAPASLVLRKKCPLYLVFKHFSSELIHAGGYRSVAIFCRHGQWGGHLLIRSRVLEPSPSRSDSFPVEKRGTVAADHRR